MHPPVDGKRTTARFLTRRAPCSSGYEMWPKIEVESWEQLFLDHPSHVTAGIAELVLPKGLDTATVPERTDPWLST